MGHPHDEMVEEVNTNAEVQETPEQAKARKDAEKAAAAEKKAEEKRLKAEADDKARKEKAEQRQKEKEEKAKIKQAEREEKAKIKQAEREEAAKIKAEEKAAAAALKAEEKAKKAEEDKVKREQEKAAAAEAKAAAKLKADQEKAEAKERAAAERKQAVEARKQAIEERRAMLKSEAARRPRSTHVELHFDRALSTPQQFSTRCRVLNVLRDLQAERLLEIESGECEAAADGVELYCIKQINELCQSFLYGESVRSYIAKLEEMNHLTMVAVEVQKPASETGDVDQSGNEPETETDNDVSEEE